MEAHATCSFLQTCGEKLAFFGCRCELQFNLIKSAFVISSFTLCEWCAHAGVELLPPVFKLFHFSG